MKFYHVTILATRDDNGHTVSFRDLGKAKAHARYCRDVAGCYSVRLWAS